MKIRNIQEFRTLWRNDEGYNMSDWDENFIGSVHNGKMFGFYRMVNGIVDNIKADLTPKLQNAQDEQAIYEFLQNAADSKSTECAIIYDENYFMVLNNGSPFTEKDLKALLNSFQGTKADKSKPENCGKIGRYGIGFKLAYRLMGKSDGADELINQLAGPLLFSWKNTEDFNSLLNYKVGNAAQFNSGDSWLLKIILTCFPVGLNESVKDLNYDDKVLFDETELTELCNFMSKHRNHIERLNLNQGSMFFLKFGPKKHEKLKESLLNVQSGIGYSMNTLKTLEKVILQEKVVEKYDVEFEQIIVQPGTEDFLRIDPEFPNCPIEISLGFPRNYEQMNLLRKAPSIYQFFPMRNERHNMAYFVHSTSFSKITDRTRLDDQGEANIESLKFISRTLKKNLNKYKTENFDKFALIYKSLLLSDKSEEYDAELINAHLYNHMLEFIRTAIPTNKKNLYLKDLVVLKETSLQIDPMRLGIGKEWFYWTNNINEKEIISEAANNAKIGLKRWGLKELLNEGNSDLINNWLTEMTADEYAVFVSELKLIDFDKQFIEKFQFYKCFRFTDKSKDILLSIRDLQTQSNVFLINERSVHLKDVIKELGFAVLEFDVRDFTNIFKQLEKQLDYLTNDKVLFQKLSQPCKQANLTPEHKHILFDYFVGLNGVKTEDLRELALFSNGYGQIVPLKSLLPLNLHAENWLEDFKINNSENSDKLGSYFCNAENWELYEYIIVPYWHNLVKHSALRNNDAVNLFYNKITDLFKSKSGLSKPADSQVVYVNEEIGFADATKTLYFRNITDIEDYSSLGSAVKKVFDLYLPEKSIFKYLTADPVRLLPVTVTKEWRNISAEVFTRCRETELTGEEKTALFQLLKLLFTPDELKKIELFENNSGEKTGLNKLLPPANDTESWLIPFQIKDSENSDFLSTYLLNSTEIYNQIVCEKWESIIGNPSLLNDIESFYSSVEKYYYQTKLPKSINSNKLIFVDDDLGFVSAQEICYHPDMENLEYYQELRKAIYTVSGLFCSAKAILPFLNRKPFKIKEISFVQYIKNESFILSKEEVQALMQFMDLTKEDFFKSLVVQENENAKGYLVIKRGKTIPYFLEKSQTRLADKIREVLGDVYKQLPPKLFNPNLRNEGLLTGTALFNQLSRTGELSPDFMAVLITENESTEIREMILSKINKIVLKQSMIYDRNSFEHQALQIFRSKEADYEKTRNKIYIEDIEGNLHKLSDIAFESTINIAIEREGKYQLNLSEVLPHFVKIQSLLNDVFDKFVDFEAPAILKKRCFENTEMPLNIVYNELKTNYTCLKNASQLAFLVLYLKMTEKLVLLDDFQVLNIKEELTELKSTQYLHINSTNFINESIVLHDSYSEISKLLKLTDKRSFFDFAGHKLFLEPYFDKNIFHCYPVRRFVNQTKPADFDELLLNYCFEKWKNSTEQTANFLINSGDYQFLNEFNSYVFPEQYALDIEKMPSWIESWLGTDAEKLDFDDSENYSIEIEEPNLGTSEVFERNKINFLVKLGLNAHHSKLVKLRRYFLENKGLVASQKLLNDIFNQKPENLNNTIYWLDQNNAEFNAEDDRIHWLRKLYNTMDASPEFLPLPYISKVNENDQIFYRLGSGIEENLYYFENRQQLHLAEKYDISLNQFFNTVKTYGFYLSNLALKNIEINSGTFEELLDIEYLVQESKEWAASHYLKWREEVAFRVYIFQGKIPFQLRIFGKTIKILKNGNAVVHERLVFVNANHGNVEDALFEIANRNNLTELMLLQLLRYKNETEEKVLNQPVIERIVEKVYVPEILSDEEELLDNPENELIMNLKNSGASGRIRMSFDIEQLSEEMLETLLKISTSNRLIVSKKENKPAE